MEFNGMFCRFTCVYIIYTVLFTDNNTAISTISYEVERVDINLLSGQALKVKVSSVENTSKFYVQLPSANECENIINAYMAEKNPKVCFTYLYLILFSNSYYSITLYIYNYICNNNAKDAYALLTNIMYLMHENHWCTKLTS